MCLKMPTYYYKLFISPENILPANNFFSSLKEINDDLCNKMS